MSPMDQALKAWPDWEATHPKVRARVLSDWLRSLSVESGLLAEWWLNQQLPQICAVQSLHGYTGETNHLRWRGRGSWVVVTDPDDPVLGVAQVLAVLATGNTAVYVDETKTLQAPAPWAQCLQGVIDGPALLSPPQVAGVCAAAGVPGLGDWGRATTLAPGPLRELLVVDRGALLGDSVMQRLMWEQTVTINTTAIGGNPGLLKRASPGLT